MVEIANTVARSCTIIGSRSSQNSLAIIAASSMITRSAPYDAAQPLALAVIKINLVHVIVHVNSFCALLTVM